jgi:hypothetical protein
MQCCRGDNVPKTYDIKEKLILEMHPAKDVVEGGPILNGGKPLLTAILVTLVDGTRIGERDLGEEVERVERGCEEVLHNNEEGVREDEMLRHEHLVEALCISSFAQRLRQTQGPPTFTMHASPCNTASPWSFPYVMIMRCYAMTFGDVYVSRILHSCTITTFTMHASPCNTLQGFLAFIAR